MKKYHLVNNLIGWLTFAIAAFTYCSTIEPTASFWDCPEFITTGYKLEIGHPPGAPFFMLTANFFSHFASDATQVAKMVNTMSALLSAMCILFLFWSITHLARKLVCKDGIVETWAQTILIMGCGVVGALAYTWSDTFWFSAVEGEVYAYSSMFTALVFWLILKWEDNADKPHSDRWLVLIFYLTGLSIGVHLLNLLCLPAIVLVYYYKRYPKANLKGSIIALIISFVLVAGVLYGVVPGIVKVGGWFEWFFVNTVGMSFNTGTVIYIVILVAAVIWSIYESFATVVNRKRLAISFVLAVGLLGIPFAGGYGFFAKLIGIVILAALYWFVTLKKEGKFIISPRIINTSMLCCLMLMIGYSSYALIVIRSDANPPMDQDSPEDIFTLGSYLSREQYGHTPLLTGQAYSSEVKFDENGQPAKTSGSPIIIRKEKTNANEPDAYEQVGDNGDYKYVQNMLFPRMWSSQAGHVQYYNDWLGGIEGHDVDGVTMPTQWENLKFFMSYQMNFMYWRYFMWNFAGRQNDIQSTGELEHGNWLSGLSWLDNARLGDQSKMPDELKENKGHNVFYCLPLILGLIGLFFQAYRGKEGIQQFWVVFFLFFMTGIAIVLYLNQTPMQPRERDYAYAGSFYAFAIWIGLGVAAVAEGLKKLKIKETPAAIIASIACVLIPIQMVGQTWDDHDRSGRYTCRDFGANYLNSLQETDANGNKVHPIIYTNGDNDTFPLWYNQETEGKRTDARVCNLSYLQTAWYIDQMKQPAYDSPSVPINWKKYEYWDDGNHEYFLVRPEMKDALAQTKSENYNPFELKNILNDCVRKLGYIPTDSIVMKIDKEAVIKSGMMLPMGKDSIPDYITISLKGKRVVYKSEIMMYEMLANCQWTRPIYIALTVGQENHAGLTGFLMQEGLAQRITPFNMGGNLIDTDRMYDNLMHKFKFGGIDRKGFYFDQTVMRMCYTHRNVFATLIEQLIREADFAAQNGDKATQKKKMDMALKALEYCKKMIPSYNVPYDPMSIGFGNGYEFVIPEAWRRVGRPKEAERVLVEMAKNFRQYLDYYNSLDDRQRSFSLNEIQRNFIFLQSAVKSLEKLGNSTPTAKKQFESYDFYIREKLANSAVGRTLIQLQQEQAASQQGQSEEQDGEQ